MARPWRIHSLLKLIPAPLELFPNLLLVLALLCIAFFPSLVLAHDDYVYLRGAYLNEALFHLKLLKSLRADEKMPYDHLGFYKVDLNFRKATKIDKEEYLQNDSNSGSPDGKWYIEYSENHNILSSCSFQKTRIDFPDRILSYAWSPKSDKIAYVTGDYADDYTAPRLGSTCRKGYCPDPGVWIYDLQSGNKTKIDITGYELSWPVFDNNIYIKTDLETVYRYRTDANKVEKTPYKSLRFSPGGRYYFIPGSEAGAACHIYQRIPHHELLAISEDLNNLSTVLHNGLNDYIWLPNDHSLLFPGIEPNGTVIYDIDTGKISKKIEGEFLGVSKSKTKILVIKGLNHFEVVDPFSP